MGHDFGICPHGLRSVGPQLPSPFRLEASVWRVGRFPQLAMDSPSQILVLFDVLDVEKATRFVSLCGAAQMTFAVTRRENSSRSTGRERVRVELLRGTRAHSCVLSPRHTVSDSRHQRSAGGGRATDQRRPRGLAAICPGTSQQWFVPLGIDAGSSDGVFPGGQAGAAAQLRR